MPRNPLLMWTLITLGVHCLASAEIGLLPVLGWHSPVTAIVDCAEPAAFVQSVSGTTGSSLSP